MNNVEKNFQMQVSSILKFSTLKNSHLAWCVVGKQSLPASPLHLVTSLTTIKFCDIGWKSRLYTLSPIIEIQQSIYN